MSPLAVLREYYPRPDSSCIDPTIEEFRFLLPACAFSLGGALRLRWEPLEELEASSRHVFERLMEADVILVGDSHTEDFHRSVFLTLLKELSSRDRRREGSEIKRTVVLECLSADAALDPRPAGMLGDLRKRVEQVLADVRRDWAYPVEAYRPLLTWLMGPAGTRTIGCNRIKEAPVPPADPDRLRRPVVSDDQCTAAELASLVRRVNQDIERLVTPIADLRGGERRRQSVILVGSGHIFRWADGGALLQRLRGAGLRVAVVMPLVPEWEIAIRERMGRRDATWYEVFEDVFLSPYVTDEQILEHAKTLDEVRKTESVSQGR